MHSPAITRVTGLVLLAYCMLFLKMQTFVTSAGKSCEQVVSHSN